MNKEDATVGGAKGEKERAVRITRARARALSSRSLGGVSTSSRPSFKKEHKIVALGPSSKRAASHDNKTSVLATADKSRAVLTDVTNICRKSHDKCIKASKFQARGYKKKNAKLVLDVSIQVSSTQEDIRAKLAENLSTITMAESHDTTVAEGLEDREPLRPCMSNSMRERVIADPPAFNAGLCEV